MDEINDFFDFSKPFKRETVAGGYIVGKVLTTSGGYREDSIVKREEIGPNYAKNIAEAEQKQLKESMVNKKPHPAMSKSYASTSTYLDQMDGVDNDDDDDDDDEIESKHPKKDDPVYERYNFNIRSQTELPIHDNKAKIMSAIRDNYAVVLQGDTGCGKTTQVPQFIIDDAYNRREHCNIICTQPRRIAAISIAQRVCNERKWDLGSLVGYQVGLHANASEDTRLLYCTTGVLLQKLVKSKTMASYTHVILDEVHERDQDMDFLLIVIRRLLATNSKHVKVILMSATIDANLFSDYFRMGKKSAPVIKVDNRRIFTVKDFYLCELERLNFDLNIEFDSPGISDELYKVALKLIVICERIDQSDDTTSVLGHKASILIFLPGINEIEKMEKSLEKLHTLEGIKLMPIRLHSMVSPDEQQRVFQRPTKDHRKVILATNIAESSITVPDVKYVIDFCLTKYLITDTNTNFTSLQLQWASRSNCQQRAGRAGRVMNGRVYRMVPKLFYTELMQEFSTPEMERCPLENVVLKSKLLDMGPPHTILGLALSPPNLSDIRNTVLILKEVGALYKTIDGVYEEYDGDLSFIGRIMSALPLDIRIARLIIFGYIFSILEETIIIAAGLSVKNIFNIPYDNVLGAYTQKMTWADGSGSDLFAILKAYRVWCTMREQHNLDDENTEANWARRYYINTRSMREMFLLVKEITDRLNRLNLKAENSVNQVNWMEREKTIILKICIAGAFYPNYFVRSLGPNDSLERDTYHVMCGNDPCRTVYFNNFEAKYIGQLYTKRIKDIFKQARIPAANIDIKFEPGTEKVFVIFKNDADEEYGDINRIAVPGRVRLEVYKALKLRQAKVSTSIKVLDARSGLVYAEDLGLGTMVEGRWIPNRKAIKYPELVVIPAVFTKIIRGNVTHIENCSKFWFQPLSEVERLKEFSSMLNDRYKSYTKSFHNPSEIVMGMILAAPFEDKYHRAKVVQVINVKSYLQFRVLFIDYGNAEIVDFDKLRRIKSSSLIDIPPRVFECCLAGIQPSSILCPSGRWPDEAMEYMQEIIECGPSELEVYSVVNSVTNVFIKVNGNTLNNVLVDKGFAQNSDETYMSKSDHDLRLRKQANQSTMDEDHSAQNEEYLRSIQTEVDKEVEPPPEHRCVHKMNLRGPFNPLETKIYSAARVGYWKSVTVERESVNSILLDTNPYDSNDRVLVAATVTEGFGTNILTTRQTTLMPNIPGFGPLISLIFTPSMQIKRNADKTRYVSILCGLGHNKMYESLFEEHDVVFNLDVEICPADLELINQIRYSMDTILYTDQGEDFPNISKRNRMELIAKVKNLIIKLLEKRRKLIQVHRDTNDHKWIRPSEDEIIQSSSIYGHRCIFPIHSGLRLLNESFETIQELQTHCSELHHYRRIDHMLRPTTCLLCDTHLENIVQLRIHLLSQLHRDRESQIQFKKQIDY